jgi:sugar lactone lactonase YvrE
MHLSFVTQIHLLNYFQRRLFMNLFKNSRGIFLSGMLMASLQATVSLAQTYGPPQVVVAPSSFKGVHGLAVDKQGRLLAGSVVGMSITQVDPATGKSTILVDAPQGQADDIAIGPKGEMAWTSFLQGVVRIRDHDGAPIRVIAKDLPGINSLAFDPKSGKLYASQVFLGDALWEIDVTGVKPPSLIKKDMGGLNGFEVGADGWIVGPLWFKGQIVKLNPVDGEMKVINSEFKVPAAANFDSKGNIWVVDVKTGGLYRIHAADGKRTRVAQLETGLDNLALDKNDNIYVSNMVDNGVQRVNASTGKATQITKGGMAAPGGIKLSEDGKALFVAHVFGLRAVDTVSGQLKDIARMHGDPVEYPFAVTLSKDHYVMSSWFTGTVQLLSRQGKSVKATAHGLAAPMDAIEMRDGKVLVLELAAGALTQLSGADLHDKKQMVTGLQGPTQMILGQDGGLYITELSGRLIRVDTADWSQKTIAQGLAAPEGLAQAPSGKFIVAETAKRQLTEVDPSNGNKRVIASDLPIGFEAGPGLPPPYLTTGVAVAADGTVYFSADRNNGIYKIKPQ